MPKVKRQSHDQRRKTSKLLITGKRANDGKITKIRSLSVSARQNKYLQSAENAAKHSQRMKAYLSSDKCKELHRTKEELRLSDPKVRLMHNERQKISQKNRLENEDHCIIHRKRLRSSQFMRLADPANRAIHNERLTVAQNVRLQDPVNRAIHNERLSVAQKVRLQEPAKRVIHVTRSSSARNARLQDPDKRVMHHKRLSSAQSVRLQDPAERLVHNKRIISGQRIRLQIPSKRAIHNKRLSLSQHSRLQDPVKRKIHNIRQTQSQIKRLENPNQLSIHRLRAKNLFRSRQTSVACRIRSQLFAKFLKLKLEGPTHKCCCCLRLFFKNSVTLCKSQDVSAAKKYVEMYGYINGNDHLGHLCSSCAKSLKAGKVPTFAITEELKFPQIPASVAKLTDLEERFVSPLIPFMTIKATIGDQYIVRGRAVNVPTSVQDSVKILPRLQSETQIIAICFRRKKQYKSNVLFENVRPKVIQDAIRDLQSSDLYKYCNINSDLNRIDQFSPTRNGNIDYINKNSESGSDISSDEEEEPVNVADENTMLLSEALVFAPGEGKKPISLFDEYAEAKCFIKIYGGKLIKKPASMSYQNWVKSEVMRCDRRCASVMKLFYSALKLRTLKVASSINFCLRKTKLKNPATVADMLDPNYVNNLLLHDSGYKVLAVDRGSPAYWEERKKEVFAMIRQLGPPTIFLTLSAAETKWRELMVILKKVVDDEEITLEEAENLEYKVKANLIKSDPVTCARYFDYRMRQLFNVLRANNSIFRSYNLIDYYIRTEFQQRGSPHLHCLLWLKNSPKYDDQVEQNNNAVTVFVDEFISCAKDPELEEAGLLDLQTHKHTFTCKKGSKNRRCRFDIPFFPLYNTTIVEPLSDVSKKDLSAMRQKRQDIQDFLAKICKDGTVLTIDDILSLFNIESYQKYIDVIRSGVIRPTLMLKRKPDECMINNYNKEILKLNCANMDIQFILDMYSCATYVVNYLNKSSRGMSKILRDASNEIRNGNYTMKEKLRMLGNRFLQASEFSAQEAVYYVLALPLSYCSRQCVFVNTSLPENRVGVVKPRKTLQLLDPDHVDIYVKNIIDHYVQRPDSLENICLAVFASWYTYSSKRTVCAHTENSDNDDEDEPPQVKRSSSTILKLKDDSGFMYKRTKGRIVRYVRFNAKDEPYNFKRETVMLFTSWRDEKHIIEHAAQIFLKCAEVIMTNRAEFVCDDNIEEVMNKALQHIEQSGNENDEMERMECEFTPRNLAVFGAHSQKGDIGLEMKDCVGNKDVGNVNDVYIPVPNMLSDIEYADIIGTLNNKQRIYLTHVVRCFKMKLLPIYNCVLGGAGVGKSRLIQALCQTLLRIINKTSNDLGSLKILLCAPTGKAAFNINGTTLHSAFALPLNQCSADLTPLSSSTRNTLYSKFKDAQLIIIDEISMVGSRTFQQIDCRLKQIFLTPAPFAGLSLITLGDFNQLAPVGDRYIFEASASDIYGNIIGNPLWRLFSSYTLTEIMRQRDDAEFAEALNNLARGSLTESQVRLFESRVVIDSNTIPVNAVRLYRSNAEVDSYNSSRIDANTDRVIVEAKDTVSGNASEAIKHRLLSAAKACTSRQSQGLPYMLTLSLDIKYMVTVNVDVEDGLVNGAVGVLKEIECGNNGEVLRVWLSFPNINVGKKRRSQIVRAGRSNWTPLDKDRRSFRPTKSVMSVIRQQFPVVPAEAITIYKSQGGTYDAVAVQLKKGLKRTELYVALSRCTSLRGLYLLGNFVSPMPPSPQDRVQMEINRLNHTPVRMTCSFPIDFPDKYCIVYQNINSLKESSHWRDLNNYISHQKPSILIVTETRTVRRDDVHISGYNTALRMDNNNRTAGSGLIIYVRHDVSINISHNYKDEVNKTCLVSFTISDVVVCTGYRSPSYPYKNVSLKIESMLENALKLKPKAIFVGDFNIDSSREPQHPMIRMLLSKGLVSGLAPGTVTSDSNTAVDLLFKNFDLFCDVTENIFSDHKQLLCVLDTASHTDNRNALIDNYEYTLTLVEAIHEGNALWQDLMGGINIVSDQRLYDSKDMMIRMLCSYLRRSAYRHRKTGLSDVIQLGSTVNSQAFYKLKTTGDGNCFYYAMSLLLCGKEKSFMKCLRALEAVHIAKNPIFIAELDTILGSDETDPCNARNVLSLRRYAQIADVLLFSYILQRPINVYVDNNITNSYRFVPFPSDDELYVHLDTNSQHYTALLPATPRNVETPPTFDHGLINTEFLIF